MGEGGLILVLMMTRMRRMMMIRIITTSLSSIIDCGGMAIIRYGMRSSTALRDVGARGVVAVVVRLVVTWQRGEGLCLSG